MKNFFFTNSLVLLFLCNTTLLLAQKETRNVGSYEGIHIAGHYDVSLFSGSEGTITLEVDAEDLDQIETYIKNGTLVIKQKKSFWLNNWFSDQVSIQIPVEEVSKVNLSGSGDIELHANEGLEARVTGSGDVRCFGDPERQITKVTGSGNITIRN